MVARRAYDEGCAAAHALDLVGERWALLVVRELLFGPKRFTDLDGRLAGVSTSVLTQRLQELAGAGVLARRKLPPPAGSWVYELTDWGHKLEPIIMALGQWGIQSPQFDCQAPVTPASMALALKGFANPTRVKNLTGLVELDFDGEVFHAFPQDGRLLVTAATSGHPDARIIASPGRLWPFLRGLAATSNNLRNNGIETEGDRKTAVALLAAMGN